MKSVFYKRESVRKFKNKSVESWKIAQMLDAARWAPSARNNQPWYFIVLDQKEQIQRFKPALMSGNFWALDAKALIIACTDPEKDPDYQGFSYSSFDVGLAVQNLLLRAAQLNLSAHPMAGFNVNELKEILRIPDKIKPAVVIAVGYPNESINRERRDINEITFEGEWDKQYQPVESLGKTLTFPVNIRFFDIDALGHVNNVQFLRFFEESRVNFFQNIDLFDSADSFTIIVVELSTLIKRPIFFGESMEISITPYNFDAKGFWFRYEIKSKKTKEIKATGTSFQLFYDYKNKKVVAPDPEVLKRIRGW